MPRHVKIDSVHKAAYEVVPIAAQFAQTAFMSHAYVVLKVGIQPPCSCACRFPYANKNAAVTLGHPEANISSHGYVG